MDKIQRRKTIEDALLHVRTSSDGLIVIRDRYKPVNFIKITQYDIVRLPYVGRSRKKLPFPNEQLDRLLKMGVDEPLAFITQERLSEYSPAAQVLEWLKSADARQASTEIHTWH